eukprot:m.76067 g.76067  ORF g.76067 m.76067 type:complete len:759 (-) comp8103_c0_seq1:70-2346(-)
MRRKSKRLAKDWFDCCAKGTSARDGGGGGPPRVGGGGGPARAGGGAARLGGGGASDRVGGGGGGPPRAPVEPRVGGGGGPALAPVEPRVGGGGGPARFLEAGGGGGPARLGGGGGASVRPGGGGGGPLRPGGGGGAPAERVGGGGGLLRPGGGGGGAPARPGGGGGGAAAAERPGGGGGGLLRPGGGGGAADRVGGGGGPLRPGGGGGLLRPGGGGGAPPPERPGGGGGPPRPGGGGGPPRPGGGGPPPPPPGKLGGPDDDEPEGERGSPALRSLGMPPAKRPPSWGGPPPPKPPPPPPPPPPRPPPPPPAAPAQPAAGRNRWLDALNGNHEEDRRRSMSCSESMTDLEQWRTRVFHLCKPASSQPSGSHSVLRCFSSDLRGALSHGKPFSATTCLGENILVDSSNIKVSPGGEEIEAVMGRTDEAELPQFLPGAMAGACDWMPPSQIPGNVRMIDDNFITHMTSKARKADLSECAEWIEKPVLLVRRLEYANVYHSMGDWASVFQALRLFGLAGASSDSSEVRSAVSVIFMDGHAKSNLDGVWTQLFTNEIRYVKSLTPKTCFRQVILGHIGHSSILGGAGVNGLRGDGCSSSFLSEFRSYVLRAYGIESVPMQRKRVRITVRTPYLAHPRLKLPLKATRSLQGIDELIRLVGQERPDIDIATSKLAELDFREQMLVFRESHLIIGVHGAGLSHTAWMHPDATVVEIDPGMRQQHFDVYARLFGVGHEFARGSGSFHGSVSIVPQEMLAVINRLIPA